MKYIKLFLVAIALSVSLAVTDGVTNSAVHARTQEDNEKNIPIDGGTKKADCNSTFLTLPAWYNGLSGKVGGECQIVVKDMRTLVTRIVINITNIILQLVGYAATVFLIIGGYKYLLSAGDPNKMTAAKNTILHAVIGLVISLFSVAIVNIVAGAL
jgi:hypothetical protein